MEGAVFSLWAAAEGLGHRENLCLCSIYQQLQKITWVPLSPPSVRWSHTTPSTTTSKQEELCLKVLRAESAAVKTLQWNRTGVIVPGSGTLVFSLLCQEDYNRTGEKIHSRHPLLPKTRTRQENESLFLLRVFQYLRTRPAHASHALTQVTSPLNGRTRSVFHWQKEREGWVNVHI